MKIAYVVGSYNKPVTIPKDVLAKLPSSVCLFLTAQFLPLQENLKKQLTEAGKEVQTVQPRHTRYEGQIYGCSTLPITEAETSAEAFFYVGDGVFHPFALLFDNDRPVHVYDPINGEYHLYTKKDVEGILKRRKAAYAKFLSAKDVGILVTTKAGQNRMAFAERLPKEFPDKRFTLFLAETLDFDQLMNFPQIEVYINTMCPRIGLDDTRRTEKPIINMEEISRFRF